jgi:hypothetical protein
MGGDHFRLVVDIDGKGFAALRQRGVDGVVDQRLAGHFDQRLGLFKGQRPHAGAKPGGEQHHVGHG